MSHVAEYVDTAIQIVGGTDDGETPANAEARECEVRGNFLQSHPVSLQVQCAHADVAGSGHTAHGVVVDSINQRRS